MAPLQVLSSVVAFSALLLGQFVAAQSPDDGVATYTRPTCGPPIPEGSGINLGDLSDESKGPALMRLMFCERDDSKPAGASYERCGDGEKNDCTREDKQPGYTLSGSYHRFNSDRNRAQCRQAYMYIIEDCFKKGLSSGKVEFGDGSYRYEMSVSAPDNSGQTPAQKFFCHVETLEQPKAFPDELLYYMREVYCAAGGCEGRGENDPCQVTVDVPGNRINLMGMKPKGQTATQFSQSCYDDTEALLEECWKRQGKKGGVIVGDQTYYWIFDLNGATEPLADVEGTES